MDAEIYEQFLGCDTIDMQGGKIIGEGVDGCVLTEPMWPCSADSGSHPNPSDPTLVSKIVLKTDPESEFIKAATRLLGADSKLYIAGIQAECSPANLSHSPVINEKPLLQSGINDILEWPKSKEACGKLKPLLQSENGIKNTHKIMYISRYPMTVNEWVNKLQESKSSLTHILNNVIKAISPFVRILQKLYQNSHEQLIHIDLHNNNIFIRPSSNAVQFGISDFGHCLLRQHDESKFFGKFLCENLVPYVFYASFSQVPLEVRILNFCYKKNYDTRSPRELIEGWLQDPYFLECLPNSKFDLIMVSPQVFMKYLFGKPLFIAMLETIQSISKKTRLHSTNPIALTNSLSNNEKIVLEFMLTRYSIVSPINTITESILSIITVPQPKTKYLTEFISRMIFAPYDQQGSSLSASLKAIQSADMTIAWSDVLSELSSGSAAGKVSIE